MNKLIATFLTVFLFIFSLHAEVELETNIIFYNDSTPIYGPFEMLLMNEMIEGKSSNSFFETWNDFVEDIKKKEMLNYNELKYIKRSESGVSGVGIHKDAENITWFVKRGQNPHTEYLASRLMQLILGGDVTPCVKLIFQQPQRIASRGILGFEARGSNHTEGWIERDIAIEFMGLSDPNSGNLGVVEKNGRQYAARVDYDHAFYYTGKWANGEVQGAFHLDTSGYTRVIKEAIQSGGRLDEVIDAIESIIVIPDSALEHNFYSGLMALYVVNHDLDFKKYQQLIIGLLERKKALPGIREKLIIVKNFLNEPTLDCYSKAQQVTESGLFGELSLDVIAIKVTGSLTVIDWMLNNGVLEKEKLKSLIFKKEGLNKQEMRYFIDQGVDLNGKDPVSKQTILTKAVQRNDKPMITILLEEGADINDPDLLVNAVMKGDLELLQFLLAQGAKNASSDLLSYAVLTKNEAIVELILGNFFDCGDIVCNEARYIEAFLLEMHKVTKGGKYSNFAINTAISLGDSYHVQKILGEEGFERNKNKENSFFKALEIYESGNTNEDMHSILINFYAYGQVDLNIRDKMGETLLHKAAKLGDKSFVESLLAFNTIDADARNLKGERPSDLTEDVEIKHLLAEKESTGLLYYLKAAVNYLPEFR